MSEYAPETIFVSDSHSSSNRVFAVKGREKKGKKHRFFSLLRNIFSIMRRLSSHDALSTKPASISFFNAANNVHFFGHTTFIVNLGQHSNASFSGIKLLDMTGKEYHLPIELAVSYQVHSEHIYHGTHSRHEALNFRFLFVPWIFFSVVVLSR